MLKHAKQGKIFLLKDSKSYAGGQVTAICSIQLNKIPTMTATNVILSEQTKISCALWAHNSKYFFNYNHYNEKHVEEKTNFCNQNQLTFSRLSNSPFITCTFCYPYSIHMWDKLSFTSTNVNGKAIINVLHKRQANTAPLTFYVNCSKHHNCRRGITQHGRNGLVP